MEQEENVPGPPGFLVAVIDRTDDPKGLIAWLLETYLPHRVVRRWVQEQVGRKCVLASAMNYHFYTKQKLPNFIGHMISTCYLGAIEAGLNEREAADFAVEVWILDPSPMGKQTITSAMGEWWREAEMPVEMTHEVRSLVLETWDRMRPRKKAGKTGMREQEDFFNQLLSEAS